MSSWWRLVDISKSKQEFSPVLPHIAGVIENSEDAAFDEIKEQIEKDLERTVSDKEILKALENGVRLGIFQVRREFKVCREFTTQEIKKSRDFNEKGTCEVFDAVAFKPSTDKNLMNYVKTQRAERRNKMHRKDKKARSFPNKFVQGNVHLYRYLCEKCKKSVERELVDEQSSSTSSEEENDRESRPSVTSLSSSNTADSGIRQRCSGEAEKLPEKSRLLVEKNPMETDPPYYDIFT